MAYPLVVYTKDGEWKRVLNEVEEEALRPEYKRWLEWKQPETVNDGVKIQNDVAITPDATIIPIRKPGRPAKR